jgi:hypothetical protein
LLPGLPDLERFEVRRALGAGGLGVVYEAIDRATGAAVAIKTLHDVTPDALYRMQRELQLLQGLEHPNVCQHYELFEHDGRWYVTMECVRGEHILDAIRDDQGDYDEVWLRDALSQLANALCALHEAGLVHRDLKPSNVLVEPSGRVVLIDFGFVETRASSGVSHSEAIVGTPHYMAPEQAVQGDVGPAADWYSFGVLLFEALTRRLPHDGDSALSIMLTKQHTDAPRASSLRDDVPPDLDRLCAELLRADPARRPVGGSILRRLGGDGSSRDSRLALTSSIWLGGPFVGRNDELAALRTALVDLENGRPIVVILEGTAGIGKSSLVRRFSDEAFAAGALVLSGQCYEHESVPYKAFDSVIDGLARHLRRMPEAELAAMLPRDCDLLVRAFPALGGVSALASASPTRTSVSDPHEQRNRAFSALRELFQRLTLKRPLVLTIDDWQWADSDSVVLARDLMLHRESPAMLFVLTARPSADADSAARLDAIATPATRRIRVDPLAEAQAVDLVGQLRRQLAPSLVLDPAAIARATRGHPLYITELVRHAAARGSAGEVSPTVGLDAAILARIAEFSVEGRAILDVLAVAGEPLPLALVRDVVDLDPALVQREVAIMRVAHLVRGGHADGAIEPYHDRVRQVVVDHMDEQKRTALHKRIAHAIEASPLARVRPELLLRHLDSAGETTRSADVALEAAQRAVVSGAFDHAASLYSLALRDGHFDEQRARALRIEMGHALANAGHADQAAQAFLAAATGAGPATRLDCYRQAAEQLLMVGEVERGLEVLGDLLADVDVAMPPTQKRAFMSVVWSRAKLRLRGLKWKDRRETEIAPETLLRLDVLKAASHSLGLVDNIRGADFNARFTLLALRVGERTRCVTALATEAVFLSSQGGRGVIRARELIDTVRKIASESGDPRVRAFVSWAEGVSEYWVCHLSRAEELIREAERTFRDETTGTSIELKTTRIFLMWCLRHRGLWAQLRALRHEYVEDAERRGDRYIVTSVNRYLAALWLAADDADGARRMLADARWMLPDRGFHTQHWYELEARAETAMYDHTLERDLDEIQRMFDGLTSSVLLRVTTVRALEQWLRGRLALCLGDRKAAQRAVARLARVDNLRAGIFGSMLEAAIAGRSRDTVAVAKLRAASAAGDEHGLRMHAAIARYHLGKLLGGSEGSDLVAGAEGFMIAEGVANPERFANWFLPGLQK